VRRSEIDGLRSVAIIPVLLFHADAGFSGGFVGVDVFFVISGYLISSQILSDGDDFSLVTFWERRVRRILPAALVMVLATALVGWFVLFPPEFAKFGRSAAAQAFMLSNVYFWRDIDYFAAGEVRPLLHTWSLAIEEQFYLFLPIFLAALWKRSRLVTFCTMAVAALASLALSARGVHEHPSAAFYLLPFRAWELLCGVLLATAPWPSPRNRWVNETLSLAGLAAILFAAFTYYPEMRFPGPAALVPCLGAAAIILSNTSGVTYVGKFLSLRPIVFIGLISYSLYLWHWPVLTFAHYRSVALTATARAWLLALILILAWLSWRFVERPIRQRLIFGGRPALFVAAAALLLTSLVAGVGIASAQGVPSRWAPGVLQLVQARYDRGYRQEVVLSSVKGEKLIELGFTDQGPIELLVWGDSHAMAILHVVDSICHEARIRCVAATHSSTAPILDFPASGAFSLRADAIPYSRAVVDFVRAHGVRRVLLAGYWKTYGDARSLEPAIVRTVSALRDANARVLLLKDVPVPGFDVPVALANARVTGEDFEELGFSPDEYIAANTDLNRMFDRIDGVETLDPLPYLEEDEELYHVERDGRALYFDHQHLSPYGAMQLKPLLAHLVQDCP
jgi:peptidoglycan/LPS O-acetylase OafA/YrhL